MKNLFIVKNISSGETNNPSTYRKDASLNGDTYSLIKKNGTVIPTGDYVFQLSENEFKAAYSLPIFTNVFNGIREYKRLDKEFCREVELQFESDAGSLSKSDTDTLISLLDKVTIYLDRNSPQHVYSELQTITPTVLFPQSLKDKYLLILETYLNKFPR